MPQPNIVFITCHDLGQHLGCYDQPTVPSPALDRIAERGVLFENSFCTAPPVQPQPFDFAHRAAHPTPTA